MDRGLHLSPDGGRLAAAVIDLFSRRVVGWSMSAAMTAQLVTDALVMAIWRHQITEAFPWNEAPRYLIRDRDQVYGALRRADSERWASVTNPSRQVSPWQNGFAERLIGSIRRECVDHLVVLGETHLRRVLKSYARYYNEMRTHRSLDKDAPFSRPVQRIGRVTSHALLGGLHHHYMRV
jgi:transposase InsO family protein